MKPVLYRISPWDKNSGTSIEFKWGGAAITGCKLNVYDTTGANLVTTFGQISTMQTRYPITPATSGLSALSNGSRYIMTVIVYSGEVESEESDGEFFYCFDFEAPSFVNESIVTGKTFARQTITTTLQYRYKVDEGDELSTFNVIINKKTGESDYRDTVYTATGSSPDGRISDDGEYNVWEKVLTITLNTPNAKTDYRITAAVRTLHGADIAMDAQDFSVNYSAGSFSSLELTNYPKRGYIGIEANLTAVQGHLYDLSGTEIDPSQDMFFQFPTDADPNNWGLNLMSGAAEDLSLSVGDAENKLVIQGDTWNLFLNLVDFKIDVPLFTFTTEDGFKSYLYGRHKTFYMYDETLQDYTDKAVYYIEYIDSNLLEPVIVQSNFFSGWTKYEKDPTTGEYPTTYQEVRILFRRDPVGYYYLAAVPYTVKTPPQPEGGADD